MGTRGSRRVRHWEIKSYFMLRLKYEDKGMQSGINEFLMSCLIILWVSITPVSCLHPAPRRGGPLQGSSIVTLDAMENDIYALILPVENTY